MGRFIASLGTESEDGSTHLTAVWYLFEDGCLYVATSSRSRKARNVLSRSPGFHSWWTSENPDRSVDWWRCRDRNNQR